MKEHSEIDVNFSWFLDDIFPAAGFLSIHRGSQLGASWDFQESSEGFGEVTVSR